MILARHLKRLCISTIIPLSLDTYIIFTTHYYRDITFVLHVDYIVVTNIFHIFGRFLNPKTTNLCYEDFCPKKALFSIISIN